MHLESTYLIVKDFGKSLDFYEKLLQMKVSNMFAMHLHITISNLQIQIEI